jgi:hypothetical protein
VTLVPDPVPSLAVILLIDVKERNVLDWPDVEEEDETQCRTCRLEHR